MAGVALLSAALCVAAFHSISSLYGDYRLMYGSGVSTIPSVELVFYVWYATFGGGAVLFATIALRALGIGTPCDRLIARLCERPRLLVACAAALLFAISVLLRCFVLQAPQSDDESSYLFIARTLLEGRLKNPSPGDSTFFTYQFVVHDQNGWYGKYPIGHPLLLALGEAIGLRALVNPLLIAVSGVLTYQIGKLVFGERPALLATLFLCVSPQFVLTGATDLSQPASALCMLLGVLAILNLCERRQLHWAFIGGAAFGFGLLVRPLPGAPFVLLAGLYVLWQRELALRTRVRALALAALPVCVGGATLFLINQLQTGDPLTSGYVAHSGGSGVDMRDTSIIAASIGGALVRQHFWLLGWAIGFLFVPFARGRRIGLLWLMIAGSFLYRVIAPKTVLGSTGPIYMFEIVPLLVLFTVSGARELAARCQARDWILAGCLASVAIALFCFAPVQIGNLKRSSDAWLLSERVLEPHTPALVFANAMVQQERGDSWAYFPPAPHPDLSDPIVYVRRGQTAEEMYAFWQRRFPARRAFVYGFLRNKAVLFEVKSPADFNASAQRSFLYQEP